MASELHREAWWPHSCQTNRQKERGPMNFRTTAAAAAVLAASLVSSSAFANEPAAPAKKKAPVAKKKVKVAAPSVEDQIQALRKDLEGKIDTLKGDLANKDTQLKQAQQSAADAQASAAKAEAAAAAGQQAVSDNATAVSTLKNTVEDLKGNQLSLTTTISDETSALKKQVASPDGLYYKGIKITPGGFMAAETVYRSHATGADIPTPFSSIPFNATGTAHLSEFYGTGRQSRISLMAEGKTEWGTMHGYVEADFLSAGTNSNNNQSNSYVMRQRVVWADADLKSGWGFAGGQMWSMATETKKGISHLSGDIATPQTIDPNYVPGFVWTRQYGFRVTKALNNHKVVLGVAAEAPQVLSSMGTVNLNTEIKGVQWGIAGANGGNYNAGTTGNPSCSTSLSGSTYTTSCTEGNLTTYAINPSPDFIVKAAFDPGYGHYEIIGIARLFRDRIYPTSGAGYNDTEVGGGIGASARIPVLNKKLDLGVKGLYGAGVGRYGNSTLADVTIRPNGTFEPLHTLSALGTAEWHATKRLDVYANYGLDYVQRTAYLADSGKYDGYGWSYKNSGCGTEVATSGTGTTSTGLSNCSGDNRNVQEGTIGYWYDFYKGPHGRLRQSIQYGYAVREVWNSNGLYGNSSSTATTGFGPKAVENMIWTSFRYYLP